MPSDTKSQAGSRRQEAGGRRTFMHSWVFAFMELKICGRNKSSFFAFLSEG
jgi:hypothetical protein